MGGVSTRESSSRGVEVECVERRPNWIADDAAYDCAICAEPFTVLLRRHHCRSCGCVCCKRCVRKEKGLENLGYRSAVKQCKHCIVHAPSLRSATANTHSTTPATAPPSDGSHSEDESSPPPSASSDRSRSPSRIGVHRDLMLAPLHLAARSLPAIQETACGMSSHSHDDDSLLSDAVSVSNSHTVRPHGHSLPHNLAHPL
eukprot:TRINITY_DN25328_c0_g1_i1.p1 TRINITY_DN25328_c0_g1~~TRINITY_DN25328_c0_g1_i1.p1  ORF type:complete len:201 (+),score=44.41 TRINITY_DN25328_c0_g1_i1:65-667(+)